MPPGKRRDSPAADVDVEAVAADLYLTPPAQFIARRDEQAVAAQKAGHREAARGIGRLRRPTLAAWASNLPVHQQPGEVEEFLQLGRALCAAYRDLDRDQVRELNARQGPVITALARQAVHLARDAGQRITDTVQREIETTLRAALADEDAAAQWAAARLHTSLTPPALPPAARAGTARPRSDDAQARTTRKGASASAAARGREREQEQAVARARAALDQAQQALHERQVDQAAAGQDLDHARADRDHARRHVHDLEQQLQQARQDADRGEHALQEAQTRKQVVDKAVREAERTVRASERGVQRLDR